MRIDLGGKQVFLLVEADLNFRAFQIGIRIFLRTRTAVAYGTRILTLVQISPIPLKTNTTLNAGLGFLPIQAEWV